MRRYIGFGLVIVIASITASVFLFPRLLPQYTPSFLYTGPRIHVDQLYNTYDENGNGVNDTQDLIDGAREEVKRAPAYRSAYYQGGTPPNDEGVCTDVVWRAFKHAGYDLKKLVDEDITQHVSSYTNVHGKPDPNIDYRRVPNLVAFFKSHATVLTTELKPGDAENLKEWQGGDIVMFGSPVPHIGILSDVREANGVPLMIHAPGSSPKEDDGLPYWSTYLSPIVAHVRWPGAMVTAQK